MYQSVYGFQFVKYESAQLYILVLVIYAFIKQFLTQIYFQNLIT